jgi:copper chaperone CopZ
MKDIVISISGMSCGHCLNAVNRAVASLPDIEVRSVRIGRVELLLGADATSEQVKAAIEKAGYKVEAIVPAQEATISL